MEYKNTSKDKRKRYASLKRIKDNLVNGHIDEFGNKMEPDTFVLLLLKWQKLPSHEREVCYLEWDKYYGKVMEIRICSLYKEMCEATKINNLTKIAELHKESMAMRKEQIENGHFELAKPNFLNPYEFLNKTSTNNYLRVCKEINILEKESKDLDEIGNIF